jgi:ribosomal protein S18 acetylase RimI-like enzyme
MKITRRPATPEDEALARRLHESGYRDVVMRQFGLWDPEQQACFFIEKWFPDEYEILQSDQVDCGYLWVADTEDCIEIMEIAILPEYQNQGIGSHILEEELARARARDVPVRLGVLQRSEAVALYRRLGFREYDRTSTHILMQREWRLG